jgi:hypothetical protein
VRSPVDICLGTRPSQAAKSRPLENTSPAPIAATIALEMIGPMPGTLISRSQLESRRAALGWFLGRKYDRLKSNICRIAPKLFPIFPHNCINYLFRLNAATLPDLIDYRAAIDQSASEERQQAFRPAGRAADQIRANNQHEDCQSARPHRAALVTRPRHRGDRIEPGTSENGTFETYQPAWKLSAYRGRPEVIALSK